MTISWTSPPLPTRNGEILSYWLRIDDDSGFWKEIKVPTINGNETSLSYVMDSLKPRTLYVVKIAAVNLAGIGKVCIVQVLTNEGKEWNELYLIA